jgi:hypothetical protein
VLKIKQGKETTETMAQKTTNTRHVSHPDPNGPADLTPIQVGEVWENPVTRERVTILELPFTNPAGRAVAELTALVGARVVGEHRHPVTHLTAAMPYQPGTINRAGNPCGAVKGMHAGRSRAQPSAPEWNHLGYANMPFRSSL